MENSFWHQRWENNEIGFHLIDVNPLLIKYFHVLNLKPKSDPNISPRVFLPLCGKTLDIAWLLAQGYRVAGAELSRIAIEDLFKSLNLTPTIKILGDIAHYSAANIDIFVGDIFMISPAMLGKVDAVYDRAALVALPSETRKRYTAHIMALSLNPAPNPAPNLAPNPAQNPARNLARNLAHQAPQLLICFEYDQSLCAGPPFSISAQEVKQHYQAIYNITLLASEEHIDGLKGQYPATEHVWWLKP